MVPVYPGNNCIVCNVETADQTIVYHKWGHPVRKCHQCGLGSVAIESTINPKDIYDDGYFTGQKIDGYANYASSGPALSSEFRRVIKRIRKLGPKVGKLLEIGCAYGFFLDEASKYYHCVGVDVSVAAVKFARARGLKVYQGVLDRNILTKTQPFDVVVMLDVIEHLSNPGEILGYLHEAMTKDGLLLITTGDWNSLYARIMGKRWRLMTPPQHLYYFSKYSLTLLLKNKGFRIIRCNAPFKKVSIGLMIYQLCKRTGIKIPLADFFNRLYLPVNLFDTICVIARKI